MLSADCGLKWICVSELLLRLLKDRRLVDTSVFDETNPSFDEAAEDMLGDLDLLVFDPKKDERLLGAAGRIGWVSPLTDLLSIEPAELLVIIAVLIDIGLSFRSELGGLDLPNSRVENP